MLPFKSALVILKAHKVNKPMKGHFAKADIAPKRYLREFRVEDTDAYNVGDLIKADVFAAGDKIDVTGTSKGKGWAGVVKRWNFSRLKESHGTGPVGRKGGSIGACSDPSRIFKGKKMAGHLGAEKVTVQNFSSCQGRCRKQSHRCEGRYSRSKRRRCYHP